MKAKVVLSIREQPLKLESETYPEAPLQVLNYDLESAGFLSALPSIALLLCAPLFNFLIDTMRERHCMSNTNARKFATTLGTNETLPKE